MLFKVRIKATNTIYTVCDVKQNKKGNKCLFLVFDEGIHEWVWLRAECCVLVEK